MASLAGRLCSEAVFLLGHCQLSSVSYDWGQLLLSAILESTFLPIGSKFGVRERELISLDLTTGLVLASAERRSLVCQVGPAMGTICAILSIESV